MLLNAFTANNLKPSAFQQVDENKSETSENAADTAPNRPRPHRAIHRPTAAAAEDRPLARAFVVAPHDPDVLHEARLAAHGLPHAPEEAPRRCLGLGAPQHKPDRGIAAKPRSKKRSHGSLKKSRCQAPSFSCDEVCEISEVHDSSSLLGLPELKR